MVTDFDAILSVLEDAATKATAEEFEQAKQITSHMLAFLSEHYPDRSGRAGVLALFMALSSVIEADQG